MRRSSRTFAFVTFTIVTGVLAACSGGTETSEPGGQDAGASSSGASGRSSSSSGGSTSSSSGGSSGSSTGSSSGSSDGAATCNTIVQQGAGGTLNVYGTTSPNVPAGGTVALGTYTLTAIDAYMPGEQPETKTFGPETMVITATTFDVLREKGAASGADLRFSATWSTNGLRFVAPYTCSSEPLKSTKTDGEYTATSNALVFFARVGDISIEVTYTKKS